MVETYALHPKCVDGMINYEKLITLKRLNVELSDTEC